MLGLICMQNVYAQQQDTVRQLHEVTIHTAHHQHQEESTTMNRISIPKEFFEHNNNGNVIKALEELPGVQSIDIGSGFSKPMIRGAGFNRIAVVENGIKQQGQQWGADHGLEIDAFNVEGVNLIKGAASLLYGSDAMGGVLEIRPLSANRPQGFFGELSLLGKSVNDALGASLMAGLHRGHWTFQGRYSEQHFGDYRVPTDTIVYLTLRLPIYNGRMKNTAGIERDGSLTALYRNGRYTASYALSNAYQKSGFFPGAHGIPDVARLIDDGDARNIELPYAWVNHIKASTHQQYAFQRSIWSIDLGYQYNHREEWSAFHTHYDGQTAPATNPDLELQFLLHTLTANAKTLILWNDKVTSTLGFNSEVQDNSIGGYAFLLPSYRRQTAGIYAMSEWSLNKQWTLSGGLRYDVGHIAIDAFSDPYLSIYLLQQGYSASEVDNYQWSSYAVDRWLGDWSGALGAVGNLSNGWLFKANLGRCYRLPSANELAANGVHHGTFRHEQGDTTLHSEQGWQLDIDFSKEWDRMRLELSPFFNLYSNYIFLTPTSQWSLLPHAGQIYRYQEAPAILTGGEINYEYHITSHLCYQLKGEYVYTYNIERHTALSFSPPASMRNTLNYYLPFGDLFVAVQSIAPQNHIAQNEETTPGTTILHLGCHLKVPLGKHHLLVNLTVNNLLNTRYYNHLSFYRRVEVPEPGRNISISVKLPF